MFKTSETSIHFKSSNYRKLKVNLIRLMNFMLKPKTYSDNGY